MGAGQDRPDAQRGDHAPLGGGPQGTRGEPAGRLLRATILYLHSSAGLYGADVQLALICRGLDQDRYRAVCVLPPVEGELVGELETAGATVVRHDLAVLRRRHLTPRGLLRMWRGARSDRDAIAALAREHEAALVHANTSVILAALPAARRLGLPLVQHVREIYPHRTAGGPFVAGHLKRLRRADALVCVSAATAAQFGPAATVVHDGLARVPRPAERAAARAELGVPADRFAVALLGRINDWKGQDVLARALAQPPLADAGAVGIVAGDAFPGEEHHRDALMRLAEDLGVSRRLMMTGFRPVATVLGAADAVCVPSTRPDPLPNSALEGSAAGLPVVASRHGGLPEIVAHERTGLLVEPGDPVDLARALARLAIDRGLRERLAREASRDVCERFSAERMASALDSIYARLLAAARSKGGPR